MSKRYAQDEEAAPIVHEDDAQTKFYKQHARRSEKPHVSGRSTIYDFDEWASKTITESFQKTQEFKRNREMENQFKKEQGDSDNMFNLFCGMLVLLAVLIVTISIDDPDRENQTHTSNKKR